MKVCFLSVGGNGRTCLAVIVGCLLLAIAGVDMRAYAGSPKPTAYLFDAAYVAADPQPAHRFSATSVDLGSLRWKPSSFALGQTLYFGTRREDVAVGRRVTVVELKADADRFKFPDSIRLEEGQTYYWRVATDNGSLGSDDGQVWHFRTKDKVVYNEVAFIVASEPHYGRADNVRLNKETIDLMNRVAGLPIPASSGGGRVPTPRGVVLNGDLIDDGNGKDAFRYWQEFERDYGLNGNDGRLAYPVFEGFGNHDGRPGSLVRKRIAERNQDRNGLTEISDNGLHYSWDWDDLHLVQLNLFGGDGPADVLGVNGTDHDPEGALAFLKADLERNVGESGKRVIIFQHVGWTGGMADWWTPEAKNRFYNVVKGYHIIALFNGHSHGTSTILWHELLTIHDGAVVRPSSGDGDFLVVRVTPDELNIVQRKRDGWETVVRKPISGPRPR